MVKTSIEFTKLAVEKLDDISKLRKALKKVERALSKANTVLRRAEYY